MTEPVLKEINGDESQPATKGDVNELARIVWQSFEAERERTDERSAGLETRLDRLENTLERVLKIVESMDQRTQGWETLPARVEKLEDAVFKLESRARF